MQEKLKGKVINLGSYILMIKSFFLIFLCLMFSAFAYKEPNYCKVVDYITKDYLKEFTKPRRLVLSGYGGAMMSDIQEISLSFLSFDALNVDEARKLYVEMMEEYLKRVNNHEKIRPFLHNFPFGIDNIKLDIGFEDSKRKITGNGHVALVYIGKNQELIYRAYNPNTEAFYPLHREAYIEARKIIMGH